MAYSHSSPTRGDLNRFIEPLKLIQPNDPRTRATVGAALYYESRGKPDGSEMWINWCRGAPDHDETARQQAWFGFRHLKGLTGKDILKLAYPDRENVDAKQPAQEPAASNARRLSVPNPQRIAELQRVVGKDFELPQAYPPTLAEFIADYRQSEKLPSTPFPKLNAIPEGVKYRMMPLKAHAALGYASPNARLLFLALWSQHERRMIKANGLLLGSIEWFQDNTGIGKRNHISDGVLEIEVRGLVRVMRGRGGTGRAFPNLFLLTCFPDALGNPATRDYETAGLPAESLTKNSDEGRAEEAKLNEARFQQRIANQIELTRILRKQRNGGEE